MQIVIDIPEHIYEHAKESSEDSRDEFDAMRAIANGTQQESRSEIPNKSEIPTSCGDAISRQAVLDAFWKLNVELSPTAIWTIQNMVKDVPPITPQTPQQRTGRWIPTGYDGYADGNPVYDWWECSECGWEHTGDEDTLTAYCPNCGAKMEVEE